MTAVAAVHIRALTILCPRDLANPYANTFIPGGVKSHVLASKMHNACLSEFPFAGRGRRSEEGELDVSSNFVREKH